MIQSVFDFALGSSRDAWRDAVAALEARLVREGAITRDALTEAMTAAFGGSDASGAWSPKFGYDCAEGALVRHLRTLRLSPNAPIPCDLRAFDMALPTQARRVARTELFQQYSTPVSIGWLAARAAAIAADDLVLEPSAGTGLLAVHALSAGARLALNEIDPERRAILAELGPATDLDAFNLAALYDGERPSVVLMNPPFTVNAKTLDKAATVGFRHVEQALALLRPGGRLVAILGEMDALENPHVARLRERATLVAAIPLGASAFSRMGVNYRTQLLVLDDGPSEEPVHTLQPGALLEEIVAFIDALPPRRALESAGRVAPSVRFHEPRMTTSAKRRAAGPSRRVTEPPAPVVFSTLPSREESAMTDTVFEVYRPRRVRFHDAKPHPTPLVESAALASVEPPEPSYTPLLPPDLVRDGLISEAQLEAILYAGAAHATTISLPDMRPGHEGQSYTARRGFMLGDGGGVGKSNTIIGVLLDNFARGRRKALWLSDRQALEQDATRYWAALGGDPDQIVNANRYPLSGAIGLHEGVVFSTYATLRAESKTLDRTRIEQFIEWLGNDFDGVIVFDEAHGLQQAVDSKGERGRNFASRQGALALELQTRLPNARVLYSSATAATRLESLAYAPRLGLWGASTSFPTRKAFLEKMEAGGLAAMEVVCRDLRAVGVYVSRTLSMAGVTYERLTHSLTTQQQEHYAIYCQAWQIIANNIDKSLEITHVTRRGETLNGRKRGAVASAFESAKQRFFSTILVSLGLQTAIDDARKRLANGDSVIFQLTTTNEATQERALADRPREVELEDLDMSPRDLLVHYLETSFPTTLFEEYRDPGSGDVRSRPVLDANGNPVEDPAAIALRDDLIEKVTNLVVMDGALDLIIDAFGYEHVAEITGRKRRLVHKMVDGEMRRVIDVRPANAIIAETQAFMDGEKRVLVFSGAGDTGRSYHADLNCKNQGRRIHYVLEPGWRAERTLQGMFRSHRTNQRVAPHYVIVPTDVPAQARFTSTIARRLDQLGAMTRGQRDATSTGLFSAAENLESYYANDALRSLLHDIAAEKIASITLDVFQNETGLRIGRISGGAPLTPVTVSKFLNRLLAVDLERQAILLDEFLRRTEANVEDAIARGTYDAGVETIRPLALRTLSVDTLAVCEKTGARTAIVKLERDDYEDHTKFADALARVRTYRTIYGATAAGFGLDGSGNIMAALSFTGTDSQGRLTPAYRVLQPLGKTRVSDKQPIERHLTDDDARAAWETLVTEGVAIRSRPFYVVTGALLPVWSKLPQTLPRVYRLQTEEGVRILGRVLEDAEVERVFEVFGLRKTAWDASDLHAQVRIGKRIDFSRNHYARLARVNGTSRIEIATTDPFKDATQFGALGLLREKIGGRIRYFIPTGPGERAMFGAVADALGLEAAA
jgi:hypothetical protein